MPDPTAKPQELLLQMAEDKARKGLCGQALRYVELSLEAGGDLPGAHCLRARLLAANGHKEEAAASLSRALHLAPGQAQASRLKKILEDNPDWRPRIASVPEILKTAQAAYNAGDFKAMNSALLSLIAAVGPEPNSQLLKAWCMLGYYKEACETLRQLTSLRAGRRGLDLLGLLSPWNLVWEMPAAYYDWHFRRLKAMRPAPALKPYLLFLRYTLSVSITGTRHGKISDLEELINRYPQQLAFARISTVIRSLSFGDLEKTISCCQTLLKDGYNVWLVRCLLGEAILCSGSVSGKAWLEQFRLAAAADKTKEGEVLAWEAELRLFMKQYARAEKLLIGNNSRHALCWLGAARLELGRQGQALKDLRAAVAACPEDNEARLWLAEASRSGGDCAGALRLFREAEAAQPGNFWALAGMAATLPDKTARLACFRRAEKAWPELAKAAGGAGRNDPAATLLRLQELCGGFRRTDKHLLNLVLAKQGA